MSESGVSRQDALRALRATKHLDLVVQGNRVTIADGEKIETVILPDELSRRIVDRLAYRWNVPKHWFYNPLMIPGDEENRPPC